MVPLSQWKVNHHSSANLWINHPQKIFIYQDCRCHSGTYGKEILILPSHERNKHLILCSQAYSHKGGILNSSPWLHAIQFNIEEMQNQY